MPVLALKVLLIDNYPPKGKRKTLMENILLQKAFHKKKRNGNWQILKLINTEVSLKTEEGKLKKKEIGDIVKKGVAVRATAAIDTEALQDILRENEE